MGPHRIIIHSLDHARAALAAATALGVPVTLVSARAAGGYVGPLWFKAVIELVCADHPAIALTAVFDCGDEPGTVLGAFRAGLKHVRFTGSTEMRERLAALAAPLGAVVEGDVEAPTLDLLDARDPAAACRHHLAGNHARD